MRIILKPGGVLVIIGALSSLIVLAVFRVGRANPGGSFAVNGASVMTTPDGGISLLQNGDFSQNIADNWIFKGVPTVVSKPGPEGVRQYIHEDVVPGENAWSATLGQVIKEPLKTGDRVVFTGWFRSLESIPVHAYVEESGMPHAKIVSNHLDLTPEWREQSVIGTIQRDFAPGEAQLMLHFGAVRGTLDMADFHLYKYGPLTPLSPSPSARSKK